MEKINKDVALVLIEEFEKLQKEDCGTRPEEVEIKSGYWYYKGYKMSELYNLVKEK